MSNNEAKQLFINTVKNKNEILVTDIVTNYEDTYEMALKRVSKKVNKPRNQSLRAIIRSAPRWMKCG